LHTLQTSNRLSGKLSAAKEAPQRQQTRECDMSDQPKICMLTTDCHRVAGELQEKRTEKAGLIAGVTTSDQPSAKRYS
jgi:hypothetical protein